ncbi:RnfABCDGE type electron transport complex subunit B [Larsenimonas rhizosphaerae]|uniref:RnfABCDGE type electron transport complex subunit B n=1 Tax=Larsenimonas rhizosphaerae TaxID=2944682 RepID=UPI003898F17B
MSTAIPLIDEIDLQLPQTQCGKCGHPGCRPYARAIIEGEAINKCPPGGQTTVARLSTLLDRPELPLEGDPEQPRIAVIREEECIGCTKCIKACPVDAILGAAKQMHTVISTECTGCDLCVAPCPVDCIDIIPDPAFIAAAANGREDAFLDTRAARARARHEARNRREAARVKARKNGPEARLARELSRLAPEARRAETFDPAAHQATAEDDVTELKAALAMAQARDRKLSRKLAAADNASSAQIHAQKASNATYIEQLSARIARAGQHTPETSSAAAIKPLTFALKAADSRVQQAQRQLKRLLNLDSSTPQQCQQAREQLKQAESNRARAQQALDNARETSTS